MTTTTIRLPEELKAKVTAAAARAGTTAHACILDAIAGKPAKRPTARWMLESNPLIGRPAANGKRELVIGRRSHGLLALYRYVAEIDTIFVLAVRSPREAGYVERGE